MQIKIYFYQVTGLALLELLLAWVIASFLMISIVEYGLTQQSQLENSYAKLISISQANELFEREHLSTGIAEKSQEVTAWQQQLAQLLPKALGSFNCNGPSQCAITITWHDQSMHLVGSL